MIFEIFRQAVRNVWGNKLRTFLTMLGIIIGVMAVVVIVGLGNGMTAMMKNLYNTMNGDLLGVEVYNYGSRTVSVRDMEHIVASHPKYYTAFSPIVSTGDAVKTGTQTSRRTKVYGVSEAYLPIRNYTLAAGRGLTYADALDCKNVCVVGEYVARVLYGGSALGRTVKVGQNQFCIVGVLEAKTKYGASEAGGDDDCVFVPYTTLMRLDGQSSYSTYYVTVAEGADSAAAKSFLSGELEALCARGDDVFVDSLNEMLQSTQQMIDLVVAVLTAIAGISLLVGGVGIMNIMLMSVTERTREIGIRKALGARESAILAQFVTEAAVISALGGSIGIGFGYLVSAAANLVVPRLTASAGMELSIRPSPGAALAAFAVSAGTGILFGYLPAKRAARLDPIQALRAE